MVYIINLTVVFDPSHRLLVLRNNSLLTINLSKPATRLLIELIQNNKNEISRETLIKSVWEDYGFSPSNATLSNHISELRKAFETLGVNKDVLITIPRIGFKMNAEIQPQIKQPNENFSDKMMEDNHAIGELMSKWTLFCVLSSVTKRTFSSMRKPMLMLILSLIPIMATIKSSTKDRDETPILITTQNKCNFYLLDDDKNNAEQLEHVRKMANNERIDCMKSSHDIYFMQARSANDILNIYFMAVCTHNADMGYKNCHNYKIIK